MFDDIEITGWGWFWIAAGTFTVVSHIAHAIKGDEAIRQEAANRWRKFTDDLTKNYEQDSSEYQSSY